MLRHAEPQVITATAIKIITEKGSLLTFCDEGRIKEAVAAARRHGKHGAW